MVDSLNALTSLPGSAISSCFGLVPAARQLPNPAGAMQEEPADDQRPSVQWFNEISDEWRACRCRQCPATPARSDARSQSSRVRRVPPVWTARDPSARPAPLEPLRLRAGCGDARQAARLVVDVGKRCPLPAMIAEL
jgi:hypothetical protein